MQPAVSIVINNYNYGRFLRKAIDSVLEQSFPAHEIIVVDDGSTDDSRAVMAAYKDRIRVVEKKNGGQASAFNAGYKAATGDWIWFLDADDWLHKEAVERALPYLQAGVAKVHAPLQAVNEAGELLGFTIPAVPLSAGHVMEEVARSGGYVWPPTSGNVFSRRALDQCMPMPEEAYRLCADLYICSQVVLYGEVGMCAEPLGFYRIHGNNGYYGNRFEKGWFRKQAVNILMAASLAKELLARQAQVSPDYHFARRNVEMLMIAYRMGVDDLPVRLKRKELNSWWQGSEEMQRITGLPRYKARGFWSLLSYAPFPVVKWFVQRGWRKNERVLAAQAV